MFPDHWGSDYDYDTAMGHGAEPDDWCHEHQQRGSTCGPCVSRDLRNPAYDGAMGVFEGMVEMTADEILGAALVVMLDKIEGGAA